jgi:hypothetical protein
MALSFANKQTCVIGDRVEVSCDFTGDSSYATGGYVISPATFDLDSIDHVLTTLKPVAAAGLTFYNSSTGKLLLYTALTGTEVTNATNVSTVTGHLVVRGKGRASFN